MYSYSYIFYKYIYIHIQNNKIKTTATEKRVSTKINISDFLTTFKNSCRNIFKKVRIGKKRSMGLICSAQLLHMYNQNIINLLKLRSGQLEINFQEINSPKELIEEVIDPFKS